MIPNLRFYLAAALVVLIGLSGIGLRHHWIQEGSAQQKEADRKDLERARAEADQKEEAWRKQYADVKLAFDNEVEANRAQPHIGPVRVCRSPPASSPVPTAPAGTGSATAGAGSLPTGNGLSDEGPDLGAGLEMLARSADAVVAECRRLDLSVRAN